MVRDRESLIEYLYLLGLAHELLCETRPIIINPTYSDQTRGAIVIINKPEVNSPSSCYRLINRLTELDCRYILNSNKYIANLDQITGLDENLDFIEIRGITYFRPILDSVDFSAEWYLNYQLCTGKFVNDRSSRSIARNKTKSLINYNNIKLLTCIKESQSSSSVLDQEIECIH